jgi:hypothetical protein
MNKEENKKSTKESQLIATLITKEASGRIFSGSTILITPEAKYTIVNGKLTTAPEKVEDYNISVQEEINNIIQIAQMPMNKMIGKEEYFIQIYGSAPEINLK